MLRDSMQDKWNLRTLNINFRYNIGDKDFAFQVSEASTLSAVFLWRCLSICFLLRHFRSAFPAQPSERSLNPMLLVGRELYTL